MKNLARIIIAATMFLALSGEFCRAAVVSSPGGLISLEFEIRDSGKCKACPVYTISYRGETVVAPSKTGFDLADGDFSSGFEIVSTETSSGDTVWTPPFGERSSIHDCYNAMTVKLRRTQTPGPTLAIEFRVYDAGAAFRYTFGSESGAPGNIEIRAENTEFRFLADHTSWQVTTAQGVYEEKPLSRMWVESERPLTLKIKGGPYAAIAEAALVDYPRMRLAALRTTPPCVISRLAGTATGPLPLTTPWRVVMIADSPGRLLENNNIILNLNEPSKIADTSWIKPGKVFREVTLTTKGGMAAVDFAAKHKIQYILFDAGWYGPENSDASDATRVNVDIARSTGPLDLHKVIAYAKSLGVGVILYVNHRALERQLDAILPLYRDWGVAGIKFGFVNVGSQEWTSWLHSAVRRAAEYRLMVDVHDEYRPTGYSRTYPNLMTVEGIGGDETSPSNSQTLTILFTRMLAGPADNTICYFDSRVDKNSSHAFQLAKAVALFSPWQVLYWYDRPEAAPRSAGGAGGQKNIISEEPELEFYDALPTVWDDTKVLSGEIGRYAVIARRSGDEWFIAAMNSGETRELEAPLGFLSPGKKYTAHIYSDDPSLATRTRVHITRRPVTSADTLKMPLSPTEGQAIRIVPDEK